jgi:copper chaperone CopZ
MESITGAMKDCCLNIKTAEWKVERMNRLKLTMVMIASAATIAARAGDPVAATANATNRFEIAGMHCDGCANGLTAELKQTRGVVSAQVTFSNQLAVVAYDTNRISQAALVKVAREAGFEAKPIQP